MSDYKLGTDLILSLNGKPMGYSATCKISNSTETGERVTKERGEGRFKEKYVKSVSEQITTEGFEVTGSRTPYADLKKLMLEGTPVKLTYCFFGETAAYSGTYIITSLDLDAPAGDDAKYSLTFENSGAVKPETLTAKQERTATVASAASTAESTAESTPASTLASTPESSETHSA